MDVLELTAIGPGQQELAGGKAAGLAALIRLGERVPGGFCVTTEAHRRGEVPRAEVLAAYERLGGGTVAVRSSATAEDLPDASFAGQHDTFLAVEGADELITAIRACWDSLHSERASAYREAAGIAHDTVRMAVVVQRQLGAPQDLEWAYDRDGTLWLLQSRPITTLFPAPPASKQAGPRLYVEFGHVQGMLQPVTPMGMSTLKAMLAGMLASFGMTVDIVGIGGRLYGDLTDAMRDPSTRQRLVKLMAVDFGPRAQAVVEHLLNDPRFAPEQRTRRRNTAALAMGPKAVAGILGALARPAAARARVFGTIERLRQQSAAYPSTAAELLPLVGELGQPGAGPAAITWPVVTGLLVAAALPPLLKGIASDDEIKTVLAGMPHNVTIEMDLALWQVARRAAPHRELLLRTSPGELAAAYLAGELPDFGLAAFLSAYGHRCAAEVDVGVPRWSEDPAPVFAILANYLRVTDPEQAPDRRFERAAARAESMLAELVRRSRRKRPVRGRLAAFFLRRARELAGLREAGKFAGLYALRDRRRRLLLIGADLQAKGLLERADDVMFLTLPELRTVVDRGDDLRETAARRQSQYARELRRRTVPVALLCDGTDVETLLPTRTPDGRTLTGRARRTGRDPRRTDDRPGLDAAVPHGGRAGHRDRRGDGAWADGGAGVRHPGRDLRTGRHRTHPDRAGNHHRRRRGNGHTRRAPHAGDCSLAQLRSSRARSAQARDISCLSEDYCGAPASQRVPETAQWITRQGKDVGQRSGHSGDRAVREDRRPLETNPVGVTTPARNRHPATAHRRRELPACRNLHAANPLGGEVVHQAARSGYPTWAARAAG